MGDINSPPTFMAMVTKMKNKWDILSKKRYLTHVGSKLVVDYILLHTRSSDQFMSYFWYVMDSINHHWGTIKFNKANVFEKNVIFL